MSGIDTPQYIVVEPFGSSAQALPPLDPGGATLPIPLDDPGTVVGAASFEFGFPAATMVDPETEGGVPPFGQDMQGILFMLSQYCALLQAGQLCVFEADAAAAFVGYRVGAKLASAITPGRVWENLIDGNAVDPDTDDTGWAASDPLTAAIAPAAGTLDNLDLPGASDYALDIDTSAGPLDITGFVAQRNGQTLYITCTGPNLLQLMTQNAGSLADNRLRLPFDLAFVQNQTLTIKYFAGLDRWLAI